MSHHSSPSPKVAITTDLAHSQDHAFASPKTIDIPYLLFSALSPNSPLLYYTCLLSVRGMNCRGSPSKLPTAHPMSRSSSPVHVFRCLIQSQRMRSYTLYPLFAHRAPKQDSYMAICRYSSKLSLPKSHSWHHKFPRQLDRAIASL